MKASSHLLDYYDGRLAAHGDTPAGAAWPNAEDLRTRFDVLLDLAAMVAKRKDFALCDLGCGTGGLLARLRERNAPLAYTGADISENALAYARAKFPETPFYHVDVLNATDEELEPLRCDVLVANGLFTVKNALSHEQMWDFMAAVLTRMWPLVQCGVVFNVMSDAVDPARTDLFRVPSGELERFLHELAGPSIGFRADYGLYDYMAYAVKA